MPSNLEEVKFVQYKLVSVVITFLLILCMAFAYSYVLINQTNLQHVIKLFDLTQIIFYLLSLIMSLYMFCLAYLDLEYETFQDLDDRRRVELKKKAEGLDDDGTGVKL